VKVPHPAGRWAMLGMLVLTCVPQSALGRKPETNLPDGVCGSSQDMLEAAQAGSAMVHQTLAVSMPWNDKSLNEYVNRLGQNLARTSGSQQLFTFYVVYNPAVNAQAFPGGYVVINSGAISLAESEAELASVLSHEIAHENSCHWRATPRKGNLLEMIAMVPVVMLGGPAGIAVAAGSGWVSTLANARFGRAEEQRADRLAAEYLARAGYDPHAAELFFQRLQAEEERNGAEPGGLLATHPRAVDRERDLEKFIPTLHPATSEMHDEAEFLRMRRAVRNYDEMYSSIVGVHVPGQDAPPPTLSRRPVGRTGME
jgi:beta-barrel assembly-enhancing protease